MNSFADLVTTVFNKCVLHNIVYQVLKIKSFIFVVISAVMRLKAKTL